MIKYSLVYPITLHRDRVLLGYQKKGLWEQTFNGFGGKQEEQDISIAHTAKRELLEESGLDADKLIHIGTVVFRHERKRWEPKEVSVYLYEFDMRQLGLSLGGEVQVTCFALNNLPWHYMPGTDRCWLSYMLTGNQFVQASVLISSSTKYNAQYVKSINFKFYPEHDLKVIDFTEDEE